jgi:hypothetical protein
MKTEEEEEEERDSSFVFVLKFEFEIGVWWKAGRSTGFGLDTSPNFNDHLDLFSSSPPRFFFTP